MPTHVAPSREKFDRLRAKYVAAYGKWMDQEVSLRARYGDGYQKGWVKAAEAKKLERLSESMTKASRAVVMDYLETISPRDWSYGVPCHWLYEKLTWEDAIRPVGEKLSVVPPLSYGATHPRV